MTPEKRNQLISLTLGTSLLLAIVYLTLITSMQTGLRKADQELASRRLEVKTARDRLNSAPHFLRELEASRARLAELERHMPGNDPLSSLSVSLESLCVATGNDPKRMYLESPSFDTSATPPTADYRVLKVRMALEEATFQSIGDFVASFENKFPFARIEALTVRSAVRAPGEETDPGAARLGLGVEFLAVAPATVRIGR